MTLRRFRLERIANQLWSIRQQNRHCSALFGVSPPTEAVGRDRCQRSFPSSWIYPFRRHSSTIANDEYERYRHLTQDVIKELELETERTRQSIDQTLKDQIAQEILKAAATAESVPELGPTGKYLYSVTDDTQGNRTYHRHHVGSGVEQLVFSLSFHEYQMHAMSLSVNETYVACLLSPVASLVSEMKVIIRNVESGTEMVLPAQGMAVLANVEWGPLQADGSDSLFFTCSNDLGRPNTVYACCIYQDGTIGPSELLYQNDDEAVMVDVQRTKGCKYMAIHAHTKSSSEILLVQSIHDAPILVRPRQEGVQYHVDVGDGDDVFMLANAVEPKHESGLSEELSLFETRRSALPLQSSFGVQCLETDADHIVTDMDIFKDFIALYERSTEDGRQRIRIKNRNCSNKDHILPLPHGSDECAVLSTGGNIYYSSRSLRFCVESPCSAGRTYSYNTLTGKLQALSSETKTESSYVQRRVFVTSLDGTRVPMSLIYSSIPPGGALDDDSRRPTVLIGYGAYGEPVFHGFDPTILPLLDRGFVLAYAHTRGGGELGRAWYRAGRLYQKGRVIDDYIACAEAIVGSLSVSKPENLTAKAFSAGGVTIAGAINRRPSLFGSVVLTNPFLDVTTAMSNIQLALTEHERDEWGDPLGDKTAATSIASYCPSSNVTPHEYPRMLLIGAMDDQNVPFWHPLIFSCKVRKAILQMLRLSCQESKTTSEAMPLLGKAAEQRILLHFEWSGGHHLHGAKLDVAAMEIAFIISHLRSST